MRKNVVLVDREDGNLIEGVPMLIKPTIRYYEEDYSLQFHGAMMEIAKNRDKFNKDQIDVLLYLLASLGFNNEWETLKNAEIGRQIKMDRHRVSRAISHLVKVSVLLRLDDEGQKRYMLSPYLAWRGKGKDYREARKGKPMLNLAAGE